MRKKFSALVVSLAIVAVCVSLVVGATFALFTSESGVNIAVSSANVKVTASIDENVVSDGISGTPVGTLSVEDGNLVVDKMAPGDSFKVTVHITNSSTISIKYRTILSVQDSDLAEVLSVTIDGQQATASLWNIAEGDIPDSVVEISLPESVSGENYMDVSCQISLRVEAVQANATMYTLLNKGLEQDGNNYCIYSVEGFRTFLDMCPQLHGEYGSGVAVVKAYILCDLDFADVEDWNCDLSVEKYTDFLLDGMGHTLKNLQVTGTVAGLFANVNVNNLGTTAMVRNFTIDNATVTASAYDSNIAVNAVGVFCGKMGGIDMENIHITNSTVSGTKYVAGFIGYDAHGSHDPVLTNCTISNTVIVSSEESRSQSMGGVVGYSQNGYVLNLCDVAEDVTITCNSLSSQYVGRYFGTMNNPGGGNVTYVFNCCEVYNYANTSVDGQIGLVGRVVNNAVFTLNFVMPA